MRWIAGRKVSGRIGTRDVYKFALVEGRNEIETHFVIDEELLGKFADTVKYASEGDWTEIFSVRNVLAIVGWVLDGGLLIVLVRYFIKDKKLADRVENGAKEASAKIIPEATKKSVLSATETIITPMFTQLTADNAEIRQAMNVFAKCFALSQEDTPEARKAILDELTTLKFGDAATLEGVKKYIDDAIAKYAQSYQETLAAIKNIGQQSQQMLDEEEPASPSDNGVQI